MTHHEAKRLLTQTDRELALRKIREAREARNAAKRIRKAMQSPYQSVIDRIQELERERG